MNNIVCEVIKASHLDKEKTKLIINLHQKYFNLPGEMIAQLIMKRDHIYLYYEKSSQMLIGTVGTQILKIDNAFVLYMGNAVIDRDYQGLGLFSHALKREIIALCVKHPFAKKYEVSFATTPKAYAYCMHMYDYWPKPDSSVPLEIVVKMKKIADLMLPNQYYTVDDRVITRTKILSSNSADADDALLKNFHYAEIFSKLNPHYLEGEQLLCMASINLKNIYSVLHIYKSHHKKRY